MRKSFDGILLALTLALGAISTSTIYAADKNLALNQAVFWLFGLVLLYAISHLNIANWKKFSIHFYLLSAFALLAGNATAIGIAFAAFAAIALLVLFIGFAAQNRRTETWVSGKSG